MYLNEEGIIVRRYDGAGEGRGTVQTDAHTLAGTEHLYSTGVRLEAFGRILGGDTALNGEAFSLYFILGHAQLRQGHSFRDADLRLH